MSKLKDKSNLHQTVKDVLLPLYTLEHHSIKEELWRITEIMAYLDYKAKQQKKRRLPVVIVPLVVLKVTLVILSVPQAIFNSLVDSLSSIADTLYNWKDGNVK